MKVSHGSGARGLRDRGNDVTVNVTGNGCEHARPHVEEIAGLMPQISAQMGKPQIVKCPVLVPREMVQEIVHEDDHKEETSQTYAETAKKVTIDQRSLYPAERCDDWSGRDPGRCTTSVSLRCEISSWTRVMMRCQTRMVACAAA